MTAKVDQRGDTVASRTVYWVALAAVFLAGLMFPFLGLALALVLWSTIFKGHDHMGRRLTWMGACTLIFWIGLGFSVLVF